MAVGKGILAFYYVNLSRDVIGVTKIANQFPPVSTGMADLMLLAATAIWIYGTDVLRRFPECARAFYWIFLAITPFLAFFLEELCWNPSVTGISLLNGELNVLIYLILACLYESFLVPFAVIFSVPFGLMGSFLFAKFLGLENNIYLQTGVIMLIGLLAKTAILITEYAIERRRKGMGIVESAYSAAQVRLRPILMTVLTMIFGMLPLMFSSGAGANGNSSLGTGVVGGMVVGTLALLFVVPVFYIIFEFLQEKIRKPMEEEADVQVLLEKEKSEVERERN